MLQGPGPHCLLLNCKMEGQSVQQGGLLQCCKCLGPVGSYCIGGKIEVQSMQRWGLLECNPPPYGNV